MQAKTVLHSSSVASVAGVVGAGIARLATSTSTWPASRTIVAGNSGSSSGRSSEMTSAPRSARVWQRAGPMKLLACVTKIRFPVRSQMFTVYLDDSLSSATRRPAHGFAALFRPAPPPTPVLATRRCRGFPPSTPRGPCRNLAIPPGNPSSPAIRRFVGRSASESPHRNRRGP